MEEKETIHINLLTELTGNLISEESEWEEEWTENDAYGMPLDGTDLAWYESAIREELNRYGEDDLMQYFSGSASIQEKVKSAVVTIENQEGCPQLISYSLLCKWFKVAVLPADKLLYAELYQTGDRKKCTECGTSFASSSNSVKYCPDCRKRITRRQAAERMRKRRAPVTQ